MIDLVAHFVPQMTGGFIVSIELTVASIALGMLIALPMALARLYAGVPARALAFTYGYAFRGTPLLAQLFLVYYGSAQFRGALDAIGLWWLFRNPFSCALITFALNTGAYQAEILRGAILAVPRGQLEAAKAAGMSPLLAFQRVTLPLAARYGLRPFGNEVVLTLKASALASIVTVFDLLGVTRIAFQRTFDLRVYLVAAVIYVLTVELVRRAWNRAEHRLSRHLPQSA